MDVLAHVSAKTSRRDDDRYRTQALRYTTFKADKRVKLVHHEEVTESTATQKKAATPTSGGDGGEGAYVADTQLAVSALESQLITSSLRRLLDEDTSFDSFDSAHDTSKLSAQSPSPDKTKGKGFMTENILFGADHEDARTTSLEQSDLSLAVPLPIDAKHDGVVTSENQGGYSQASIHEQRYQDKGFPQSPPGSSSWSENEWITELPSTYSISEGNSKVSHSLPFDEPVHSVSPISRRLDFRRPSPILTENQHTKTVSSKPLESPERRHRLHTGLGEFDAARRTDQQQMPPPVRPIEKAAVAKRKDDQASPTESPKESHPEEASSVKRRKLHAEDFRSPQAKNAKVMMASTPGQISPSSPSHITSLELQRKHDHMPLTQMILPPKPAVALDPAPKSMITPLLQSVVLDKNMTDRFAGARYSRAVNAQERGYWTFRPVGNWDPQVEHSCWDLLSRWIGSGNMGWGIWCVRVPDDVVDSNANTMDESVGSDVLGRVRVYCWGEAIQHVYLMLYIATCNKIRKANPVWCDATGAEVVRIISSKVPAVD